MMKHLNLSSTRAPQLSEMYSCAQKKQIISGTGPLAKETLHAGMLN